MRALTEEKIFLQLGKKKFPSFTKSRVPSLRSQEIAIGCHPKFFKPSSQIDSFLFKISFNIVLPVVLMSPMLCLPFKLLD